MPSMLSKPASIRLLDSQASIENRSDKGCHRLKTIRIGLLLALTVFCVNDAQLAKAQNPPLIIPPIDVPQLPPAAIGPTPRDATANQPQELTPAATEFIKGLALIVMPPTFTDDDDWGNTKRIQSGLNMKMDGLELKTSRRWKDVNHGLWRKVDATLIDPLKFFKLKTWLLPKTANNQPSYRVLASLRIAVTVRQQQWNRGLKVYSISSDILTDVSIDTVIDFRSKLVEVEQKKRLQILPHMESANVRVDRFLIRRISHAKGGAAKEFGSLFEGLVRRVVEKKSRKLPQKINSKIEKKADRFQISGTMLNIFGIEAKTKSETETD